MRPRPTFILSVEMVIWYLNQMNESTAEFGIFNEKLIDGIFNCKKDGLNGEEITDKLNITDFIFNTIVNDNGEIGKIYRQKEDECLFSLFIKEIKKEKITKKEALDNVGLSEKQLDELLMNSPEFQKKFEKSYRGTSLIDYMFF